MGVCQSVQQREKQREEKTGRREGNRRRGGVSDQAGGGKWSPKAPRGSKVRWYQHATNAIKATSVPFATTSPHTHLPGGEKQSGSRAGSKRKQKEKKAKGEKTPNRGRSKAQEGRQRSVSARVCESALKGVQKNLGDSYRLKKISD